MLVNGNEDCLIVDPGATLPMQSIMDDLKTPPTPTLDLLAPGKKRKDKSQRHKKSSWEGLDCLWWTIL